VQAWLLAAGVVAGIALEGILLGFFADLLLKRWHPERPGDPHG
jgi:hypothetical protein